MTSRGDSLHSKKPTEHESERPPISPLLAKKKNHECIQTLGYGTIQLIKHLIRGFDGGDQNGERKKKKKKRPQARIAIEFNLVGEQEGRWALNFFFQPG